jgi:hypothetical protein
MAYSTDRLGVQKPGFCTRYRLRRKGDLKNPVSFVWALFDSFPKIALRHVSPIALI